MSTGNKPFIVSQGNYNRGLAGLQKTINLRTKASNSPALQRCRKILHPGESEECKAFCLAIHDG